MSLILEQLVQIRDLLNGHPLFTLGALLLSGYLMGKLVSLVKLPTITGYIIAGLLLGDTMTGVVHHEMGEDLKLITDIALGLIALTIGGEFYWVKLKKMGKEVIIITVFQILLTFLAVFAALFVFGMDPAMALIMGAIATATAPAATVAIVQSLRAHGPFVDYLYGVVALDDAGCVLIFGITFALASGILGSETAVAAAGAAVEAVHISPFSLIFHAVKEILFSLLLGGVFGFLIHRMTLKKNSTNEILIITLGLVFLETALAIVFHLSPLMSNMAAGALLINFSPRNHRIFRILEPLTPPLYALFFVIAGTELNPAVLMEKHILILGFAFILSRALAKYGGVYLGSLVGGAPLNVRKFLGFCMVPQAGVAIGLVLLIQASPLVQNLSPAYALIIKDMVNIILLSVFINELIGPPLSKFAIVKGLERE